VGYGLEGAIPDARAKRITSEVVKPFFQKGDYAGGVEAGVQALLAAARGEGYAGTGRTVAETPRPPPPFSPLNLAPAVLTGLVPLVLGLARRRKTGRRLPGILAMACAAAALAAFATAAVTAHPALWLVGGALLAATVVLGIVNAVVSAPPAPPGIPRSRSSSPLPDFSDHESGSASSPRDGSSASDDSASSSSDFSGGGGDSGGGGSSDKW
jgi:uncharacterized protein